MTSGDGGARGNGQNGGGVNCRVVVQWWHWWDVDRVGHRPVVAARGGSERGDAMGTAGNGWFRVARGGAGGAEVVPAMRRPVRWAAANAGTAGGCGRQYQFVGNGRQHRWYGGNSSR